MQHAAIDSISTAPMLTGTSFSPVSSFSSFRLFNPYKADAILHGALGLDFSALKERSGFIANRRCRQIGLNAWSAAAGDRLPQTGETVSLRDKNFFEPVPPISARRRVAPGFAGLRGTALAHA